MLEQRVMHLEADMTEVKSDLKAIRADLGSLKDSLGSLKEDISYLRGRMEMMPTFIQLIGFAVAVFVAAGVLQLFQ